MAPRSRRRRPSLMRMAAGGQGLNVVKSRKLQVTSPSRMYSTVRMFSQMNACENCTTGAAPAHEAQIDSPRFASPQREQTLLLTDEVMTSRRARAVLTTER